MKSSLIIDKLIVSWNTTSRQLFNNYVFHIPKYISRGLQFLSLAQQCLRIAFYLLLEQKKGYMLLHCWHFLVIWDICFSLISCKRKNIAFLKVLYLFTIFFLITFYHWNMNVSFCSTFVFFCWNIITSMSQNNLIFVMVISNVIKRNQWEMVW